MLFFILSTILLLLAVTISAGEPLLSRSSAIAIDDGNDNSDDDSQRRLVEDYVSTVIDWVPRRDENVLPIGLTPQEKVLQRKIFLQQQNTTTRSTLRQRKADEKKPKSPRFLEEWSEMEGVLIRYPLGIKTSLVKALSERAKIFCLVDDNDKVQAKAKKTLKGAGIQDKDITWIVAPTDSYWTRDYGPWFVSTPSSSKGVAVVNHKYNRPRLNDDKVPKKIAEALGVPYYDSKVVGCGGNMMTDGSGQAAATHIAYTENADCNTNDESSVPLKSCNSVDTRMKDYFGIGEFQVVADPSGTYIDHVDCWAKYLSSDTILIREVSKNHPQYNNVEKVVQYFKNTKTSKGKPWTIARIWTDSDQPYTNSLILNGEVFVPIVNSKDDEAALEVYRKAMPGYRVSGWEGSWESTDALHCRTRGIPKIRSDPVTAPTTSVAQSAPTAAPVVAPQRDEWCDGCTTFLDGFTEFKPCKRSCKGKYKNEKGELKKCKKSCKLTFKKKKSKQKACDTFC